VSPTKDRQRAAARARLEREMAARAEAARRRRRLQAGIGAGAAVLVLLVGTVWLVSSLSDDGNGSAAPAASTSASAAALSCQWTPVVNPSATPAPSPGPNVKDVGLPPTDPPRTGTQIMTINFGQGPVKVALNLAKTPCAAASFKYLASKDFFNDSKCHRMFDGMLQCGDPSAKGPGYRKTDGTGGPSYRFADENLPTDMRPPYPKGTVALANSGPNSNGSQFFIIYKDVQLQPQYTVLGTVTEGLDVVEKIGAAGHDGAFDPQPGGGHPKTEAIIKSLTVADA
jgi:peptidyl-prolyl cis-trans isomerase B (cyclophilin B)